MFFQSQECDNVIARVEPMLEAAGRFRLPVAEIGELLYSSDPREVRGGLSLPLYFTFVSVHFFLLLVVAPPLNLSHMHPRPAGRRGRDLAQSSVFRRKQGGGHPGLPAHPGLDC